MQPASRFCALRGVRVAGGDLCRLWAAEAPAEPTGETGRLFEKSSLHPVKTLILFTTRQKKNIARLRKSSTFAMLQP